MNLRELVKLIKETFEQMREEMQMPGIAEPHDPLSIEILQKAWQATLKQLSDENVWYYALLIGSEPVKVVPPVSLVSSPVVIIRVTHKDFISTCSLAQTVIRHIWETFYEMLGTRIGVHFDYQPVRSAPLPLPAPIALPSRHVMLSRLVKTVTDEFCVARLCQSTNEQLAKIYREFEVSK